MTWGRRLLTFPDAGGLGQSSLHDMLELGLLNRVASVTPAGPVAPAGSVAPSRRAARHHHSRAISPAARCAITQRRAARAGR
ncbi:MAG TPA: hypothetical protein VFW50_43205 [Streptosporangiaceae bacterium]|nr:hypothetical protein [Streptosporangiaceae bacterium]